MSLNATQSTYLPVDGHGGKGPDNDDADDGGQKSVDDQMEDILELAGNDSPHL